MNPANLTMVVTAAAMFGCGVYLLLERSLTRVLVGVVMIGNAVNLTILHSGGRAGRAPIVVDGSAEPMSDPLPQALMLTAIVITLGTTAFVLAMAYRSWQLTEHDDVQDDVEDAAIRRLAKFDEASDSYDMTQHAHEDDTEFPVDEEPRP